MCALDKDVFSQASIRVRELVLHLYEAIQMQCDRDSVCPDLAQKHPSANLWSFCTLTTFQTTSSNNKTLHISYLSVNVQVNGVNIFSTNTKYVYMIFVQAVNENLFSYHNYNNITVGVYALLYK